MKKLVSKRGFTLAEMLIAALLLGFVTVMAAVMTSAVLNNTVIVKEVAQAEILGSEALDNIQAELRYALDVDVDEDGTVRFGHDKANPYCSLALNNEGKIFLQINDQIIDGSGKKSYKLVSESELFEGVSYGNLKITKLTFEKGKDKAAGSVKATVSVSYGDKVLWQGSVSVRPINGVKS